MAQPDKVEGATPPPARVSPLRVLVGFIIFVSIYAGIRLSTAKFVMPAAVAALSVLEAVRFVHAVRESKRVEAASELVYFLVFLSVCLGVYRSSLAEHRTFMFATILYRPNYTLYANRRLALALGLLIMAVAVPISLGVVTEPNSVGLLTALYGLFVAGLWLFCSKLGAWVFGSVAG